MTTPLTARTLDTIRCEITKEMIAIIALHAKNVIPCSPAPPVTAGDRGAGAAQHHSSSASAAAAAQSSSSSHGRMLSSGERLPSPPTTPSVNTLSSVPPLDLFITNLVLRSRVQAGTLICTLVYLQRLRRRLPKEARGMECTCHRIFLATLIVAGKYLNDASPKNKYWARYSTVFTVAEVNLMEKQLLFLLDFDLRIDNDDLNEAAAAFITEPKPSLPLTPTTPTIRTPQHPHTGVLEPASASTDVPAISVSISDADAPAHSTTTSHHKHSSHYHQQPAASSKVYPPTLGLNGGSYHHHLQPTAPASDASSLAVAKEMEDTRSVAAVYQQTHGRTQSVASIDMVSRDSRRLSQ
ncbi:hypothetical protein GQ54DRAFT_316741 [Martensiomyces pterosporus]|nr:hypothetical protein GQ54DRAFT_316741 [Martensiomyces pterosporus]